MTSSLYALLVVLAFVLAPIPFNARAIVRELTRKEGQR